MEQPSGRVTAKRDVPGGYAEEFCYECTVTPVGGAAQVQKRVDNLKIIQEPADCYDALTPLAPKLQDIEFN